MAYQIICTPQYYTGTCNAPQEHFLKWCDFDDDHGAPNMDIAEWETEEEAQQVIDDLTDGTYYLSHGEAGRPGYTIVEDLAIEGDDCYPCDGDEIYGTMVDPDDLPDDVVAELDTLNVEWHRSSEDHDIYSAYITRGDVQYAIVFCPKTLAIEAAGDDLGNVDWDHAGYFIVDD